ncbi:uncharacterized protein Z519_00369 [Cladophialophora bantiana CBS 173.52]|uniref:Uncharacterized protein n=1 Tax=Cladophialophora bantiana (strain ATCC 10958 / CBS 173.52 / CDC B-1940 / NIH 8579) TaxID=1442370 RepID=A0A0D2HZ05_CLAB1|nr:uncharacterized protein Z519_00369 [Cladophialophora bantiana CBS 173.52]KIW98708.1 hypothetical protein Z519_00369 [Cladophialophora bantiana CBS 173.52]
MAIKQEIKQETTSRASILTGALGQIVECSAILAALSSAAINTVAKRIQGTISQAEAICTTPLSIGTLSSISKGVEIALRFQLKSETQVY